LLKEVPLNCDYLRVKKILTEIIRVEAKNLLETAMEAPTMQKPVNNCYGEEMMTTTNLYFQRGLPGRFSAPTTNMRYNIDYNGVSNRECRYGHQGVGEPLTKIISLSELEKFTYSML